MKILIGIALAGSLAYLWLKFSRAVIFFAIDRFYKKSFKK